MVLSIWVPKLWVQLVLVLLNRIGVVLQSCPDGLLRLGKHLQPSEGFLGPQKSGSFLRVGEAHRRTPQLCLKDYKMPDLQISLSMGFNIWGDSGYRTSADAEAWLYSSGLILCWIWPCSIEPSCWCLVSLEERERGKGNFRITSNPLEVSEMGRADGFHSN